MSKKKNRIYDNQLYREDIIAANEVDEQNNIEEIIEEDIINEIKDIENKVEDIKQEVNIVENNTVEVVETPTPKPRKGSRRRTIY